MLLRTTERTGLTVVQHTPVMLPVFTRHQRVGPCESLYLFLQIIGIEPQKRLVYLFISVMLFFAEFLRLNYFSFQFGNLCIGLICPFDIHYFPVCHLLVFLDSCCIKAFRLILLCLEGIGSLRCRLVEFRLPVC